MAKQRKRKGKTRRDIVGRPSLSLHSPISSDEIKFEKKKKEKNEYAFAFSLSLSSPVFQRWNPRKNFENKKERGGKTNFDFSSFFSTFPLDPCVTILG